MELATTVSCPRRSVASSPARTSVHFPPSGLTRTVPRATSTEARSSLALIESLVPMTSTSPLGNQKCAVWPSTWVTSATIVPRLIRAERSLSFDSATSEPRSIARSVPSPSVTWARVRASVRRIAPAAIVAPSATAAQAPAASHASSPPVLSAEARATEATVPDHGAGPIVAEGTGARLR